MGRKEYRNNTILRQHSTITRNKHISKLLSDYKQKVSDAPEANKEVLADELATKLTKKLKYGADWEIRFYHYLIGDSQELLPPPENAHLRMYTDPKTGKLLPSFNVVKGSDCLDKEIIQNLWPDITKVKRALPNVGGRNIKHNIDVSMIKGGRSSAEVLIPIGKNTSTSDIKLVSRIIRKKGRKTKTTKTLTLNQDHIDVENAYKELVSNGKHGDEIIKLLKISFDYYAVETIRKIIQKSNRRL